MQLKNSTKIKKTAFYAIKKQLREKIHLFAFCAFAQLRFCTFCAFSAFGAFGAFSAFGAFGLCKIFL